MEKIDIKRYKEYAPVVVRIGISLVFLWFGINQIFNSDAFIGYIPKWAFSFIEPKLILLMNGIFETVFGSLLLLGLFTRISALLLSLHLFFIAINLGYNDTAIRDIGLSLATFSIFLYGKDEFCLENKLKKQKFRINKR